MGLLVFQCHFLEKIFGKDLKYSHAYIKIYDSLQNVSFAFKLNNSILNATLVNCWHSLSWVGSLLTIYSLGLNSFNFIRSPRNVQRRQCHPTPVLLPGKSHGWRSLVGCSPWDHWESDTTERLHFHFSLSCIGEGSGNLFQYSCLENPRDGVPGGLPSMGSHRVGHDWGDLAAAAAARNVPWWTAKI